MTVLIHAAIGRWVFAFFFFCFFLFLFSSFSAVQTKTPSNQSTITCTQKIDSNRSIGHAVTSPAAFDGADLGSAVGNRQRHNGRFR